MFASRSMRRPRASSISRRRRRRGPPRPSPHGTEPGEGRHDRPHGESTAGLTGLRKPGIVVPQRWARRRGWTVKKIGFLSFGHWGPSPASRCHGLRRAAPVGRAGGRRRGGRRRRRVLPGPPLRAAAGVAVPAARGGGARTSRIEIGTAVIDMRYENPLYMVEDAGAADLLAGGRLQLGISRGSPEQVIDGWRYFGHEPAEGETDADMARRHTRVFLDLLAARGSPSRTRGRCSPTRRACSASSRTHRACASGSGGAPPRPRPHPGRPGSG